MYVTRPLSHLLKSADLVAAPPDGPNSGYLVIQDEESVTYSCFGCCKNRRLKQLPFPQDKELTVIYSNGDSTDYDPLFLIPILNHPLSSNYYYAIHPHRKRKGQACTCSREEDKVTCCFCRRIKDVKPRPLDPGNIYQQFEIMPHDAACGAGGYFVAKSRASDGFPPYFLRRKGWTISTKTPRDFKLKDAPGLHSQVRATLPELESPTSRIIGKWYTPFIFVKEGTLKDQVKRSLYYEVTLEQRWDQIFSCRNNSGNDSVVIDATLAEKQVFVGGMIATWKEKSYEDGMMWFKVDGGGGGGVGLRVELVERMKWEQKRGGWMGEDGSEVKVNKVEQFEEGGGWSEFRCYVLVETFNVTRMDGSLVISCDFNHFHQLKIKWE